jgi:hypothetical protein
MRFMRVRQELVGAIAALVGPNVIGLLDVDEVDRIGGDELDDVDAIGALGLEFLQLFFAELDVLVLLVLVALHDVGSLNHLVVERTDQLLLDARPAFLVQLVERYRLRRRRRVELERYRHEAERDRPRPGCTSCHERKVILRPPRCRNSRSCA